MKKISNENLKFCLEALASLDPSDIDDDVLELRFEGEGGEDTGADISIVNLARLALDRIEGFESKLHPTQDPKYGIKDNKLVNWATEKPIPHDVPVFMFLAHDAKAIYAIDDYAKNCNNDQHQQAVHKRVFEFQTFKHSFPERMKEPDTEKMRCEEPKKRNTAKLNIYCACIDGDTEELVATTSRNKAAEIMGSSVHQLKTYQIDYDAEGEAGKLALSQPGTLFKKKKYDGEWRREGFMCE